MIAGTWNRLALAASGRWSFSLGRPPQIAFLPAGDVTVASSRLRVHVIARALRSAGIPVSLDYAPGADVLIVQKRLDDERMDLVRRARSEGSLVVYDVDDLGEALWYWTAPQLFEQMMAHADLVLTATDRQREQLTHFGRAAPTATLPCPIDYFPKRRMAPRVSSARTLRVLWFGSHSNIGLLERYLEPLLAMKDVQPVVVTNAERTTEVSERHPSIEVVPWALETFVDSLRSADITLLMHDGTDADRAKSNNKMVTSVGWGVPAVVSRTPDYLRTAIELGVEDSVFDGVRDFSQRIERLREYRARKAYVALAQPRVWHRYADVVIARRLLKLLAAVDRHTARRQRRPPPMLAVPTCPDSTVAEGSDCDRVRPNAMTERCQR
jgi:hypothetical protein